MTRPPQSGFTYIEVLLAIVILTGAATSMSFALGTARSEQDNRMVTLTAGFLLQDGISWLRSLPRLDESNPVFGVEAGETVVDDVDDLANVTETGPVSRTSTAATSDWQRQWKVESVTLADPRVAATGGSTPLLRVQCSVIYRGNELGSETVLLARTP